MIRLLEIVGLLLVLLTAVTQVVIPAYMGRRLFPMFQKPADIEQEIAKVKEELYEVELEKDLAAVKQQLNEVKQPQQTIKEEK